MPRTAARVPPGDPQPPGPPSQEAQHHHLRRGTPPSGAVQCPVFAPEGDRCGAPAGESLWAMDLGCQPGLSLKGGGVPPPPQRSSFNSTQRHVRNPNTTPTRVSNRQLLPPNRFYSAPHPLCYRSEFAPRAPSPSSKALLPPAVGSPIPAPDHPRPPLGRKTTALCRPSRRSPPPPRAASRVPEAGILLFRHSGQPPPPLRR